jgi:Ulp1 family protease
MKSACLSVVFSWTPFNSHWIAVQIIKGGTITIWDSLEGDPMRQYAQLVLPAYARLIALNPANQWDEAAFDGCQVRYAGTPQQNNSEDCGPAAATFHTTGTRDQRGMV